MFKIEKRTSPKATYRVMTFTTLLILAEASILTYLEQTQRRSAIK
jgi:hypothetical protein